MEIQKKGNVIVCPENEIKLKQGSPLDRHSSSQNKRSISVESHTSRSYPTSSHLDTAPIKLGGPTHKRCSSPKHLSLNEILVQNKKNKLSFAYEHPVAFLHSQLFLLHIFLPISISARIEY